MKFSEAMLRGFEMVDGRQHMGGWFYNTDVSDSVPLAVCAIGAANLAITGNPSVLPPSEHRAWFEFFRVWGISVSDLNDRERLPWEHIYGMAVAAGL